MYAIEFETNIKNDVMHIPNTFKNQISGLVKVIILQDKEIENTSTQQRVNEFMQFIDKNNYCVENINIPNREERHTR
ncbi:MAG: hypothetical protein QM487_16170 [Candidatus Marithrix sp.]